VDGDTDQLNQLGMPLHLVRRQGKKATPKRKPVEGPSGGEEGWVSKQHGEGEYWEKVILPLVRAQPPKTNVREKDFVGGNS